MKSHKLFFILINVMVLWCLNLTTGYSQAQFIKTNGPEGGDITDIKCVDDDIILLTTRHGGFFISFDSGDNWQERNNGIKLVMPGLLILFSVEYVNGFIFVGSNQHGIYRSSDFGENFEQVNTGIPTGPGKNVTKIVSNSNGDLFAVIPDFLGDKIMRSLNNGDSWEETGSGIPVSARITDITIDKSSGRGTEKIKVATIEAGVLESANNGNSYQQTNNGLNNLNIISIRSLDGTAVIGSTTGVHIRPLGSNNWINIDGLPVAPVTNICIKENQEIDVIIKSGYNLEYGSSNLGVTWAVKSQHRHSENPVYTHSSTFHYYGDHIGLERKNHHGSLWEEKNNGLAAISISRLDYALNNYLYALSSDNSGDFQQSILYRSTNSGDNWERFYEFPRNFKIEDVNYPFAVGYEYGGAFRGKIFKYNESVSLFDDKYTNPAGTFLSVAQRNNNDVVAVGLGGTAKTTDGGNTFSANMIGGYHVLWESYREEWILAGVEGIQFAIDGFNWGTPLASDGPNSLTSASDGYAAYKTVFNQIKLLSPENNIITLSAPGYGWSPIYFTTTIGFDSDDNLLAGVVNPMTIETNLKSFNFSSNNWDNIPLDAGPKTAIFDFSFRHNFIQKNHSGSSGLFIATAGSGVWRFGEPTSVENEISSINAFTLHQNYPNPFNPSTTISWQSPVGSWQTLKVYDLLGREVATLVNEFKPAGRYEVEFNSHSGEGRNLTSGVYFYQLKAGDPSAGSEKGFVETRKMVVLK